eukprot:TRINITY_DN844_c2_g1_i1.p1 TRINITY_DN844_c2_g1~~TRINITY_DN844_c2_g1_i1.p1  ORF type:complete len:288 (+),score=30.89 TRINITY_DN844_c2_g1_i1:149-1012(+)
MAYAAGRCFEPASSQPQQQQQQQQQLHQERLVLKLSKTRLCRYFSMGTCKNGCACNFAHGLNELSSKPDLRKTSICKDWEKGACPHSGTRCNFAHGVEDLRCIEDHSPTSGTSSTSASEPLSHAVTASASRAGSNDSTQAESSNFKQLPTPAGRVHPTPAANASRKAGRPSPLQLAEAACDGSPASLSTLSTVPSTVRSRRSPTRTLSQDGLGQLHPPGSCHSAASSRQTAPTSTSSASSTLAEQSRPDISKFANANAPFCLAVVVSTLPQYYEELLKKAAPQAYED